MKWPDNKRAAFAFIDDTDDAEMPFIADVYALLKSRGIRSTKTVWVYPVRDTDLFRGNCLRDDPDYLEFVRQLMRDGYEIGLHNVGSGSFDRDEIKQGLELFRQLLGVYPRLHVNHSYNKDNIYGGDKRFSAPFNLVVRKLHSGYRGFEGEHPASRHYWGDLHKQHIRYSRTYEVGELNLMKVAEFPYTDRNYSDCCNLLYPSVFCSNQDLLAHIVNPRSVGRLVDEGGCAIVYTHFGYCHERGGIDPALYKALDALEKWREQIWFAPVGEILDHMSSQSPPKEIGRIRKFRLEASSLWTRLKYRYIHGLDDYHYKRSVGMQHRSSRTPADQ